MKKMYAGLLFPAIILFTSCSKIDKEVVAASSDESDATAITKKIKLIEVRDDGVLKIYTDLLTTMICLTALFTRKKISLQPFIRSFFMAKKVLSNSTWYYYRYNDKNLIQNRTFGYPGWDRLRNH